MGMTYFIGLCSCLVFLLAIQLFCLGGVNFRGGGSIAFLGIYNTFLIFQRFGLCVNVSCLIIDWGRHDGWLVFVL